MGRNAVCASCVIFFLSLASVASGQAAVNPVLSEKKARQFAFDSKDALAGWSITGDVALDSAKGRDGSAGSLRVGAGHVPAGICALIGNLRGKGVLILGTGKGI